MSSRLGASLLRARRSRTLRPLARAGFWLLGVELPSTVRVGEGLRLNHPRQGLVVHPSVVIGDRVTIFHRVTIGARDAGMSCGKAGDRPIVVIEDDCLIGCGAVILGSHDRPTVLGRGTVVGANAVVTRSTEPRSTVRL